MKFVHLHVHSYFSFEHGTADIPGLLKQCRKLGMDSIALTDYNGIYGAIRLLVHAPAFGIRPVIGEEITLTGNRRIILLARNLSGYSNLCRLTSAMHLEADGTPSCTLELLAQHSRDLFALIGSAEGEIGRLAALGEKRLAHKALGAFLEIFPKESLLFEIQDHSLPGEKELNLNMAALAGEAGFGIVATNNVHFLRPSDYDLHRSLVMAGRAVHHRDDHPKPNREFYLKSPEEMAHLFREFPEALENAHDIAGACDVRLELGRIRAPDLLAEQGKDALEILERACRDALPRLYPERVEEARRQLEHELEVVKNKRFADYFLLVRDIVAFARASGIRFSCRGSASSSIILHLLGISQVDPLANGLLFERFLNPERRDIPDIDLDFDSRRRDEVLHYVLAKYGTERSCMVATVPTFEARSAVRELARAKGMSYGEIAGLTAHLPYYFSSGLRGALELLPELDDSALKEARHGRLLDMAEGIGGFPHHLSVHLGGVVVWDRLADLVPMQRSAKGLPVAQYDKDDLEALGLVKTDILSLRMLGALAEAEALIRKRKPDFSPAALPLDDPDTYELLRSTMTVGCFQLESPGMRQLLGRLQPERFSDIVANISLFRPGPMQADMVTPFIERRWGRRRVIYPHPLLEPVLRETYGVIVFQEQVLRVSREIAGFTLGQADLLRRAITQEITVEEMRALKLQFVRGAVERGVPAPVAVRIFGNLAAFASFGFPKAHAVSFARLAYESAYLKVHYPSEFFLGLLNNEPGLYPPGVLANEARRCGVEVLGVDVNGSGAGCTLSDLGIRAGLSHVRGIGAAALKRILRARADSPFTGLADFRERTALRWRQLAGLILCGAFDSLEGNRRMLLMSVGAGVPDGKAVDFSPLEKARSEHALTGLTFTGHPVAFLRSQYSTRGVIRSSEVSEHRDGERIAVIGRKVVLHTPPTRSGRRVVFLTLEDEEGLVDVTMFPDVQQQFAKVVFGHEMLLVEGRLQRMYPRAFTLVAERVAVDTEWERPIDMRPLRNLA